MTCFDHKFTPFLFTLQVGSFYAMHFVANMLVTVAAVLYSCESSGVYAMFLFVYLGVSVVSVNILGHRCVQDHTPLTFTLAPTLTFTLTITLTLTRTLTLTLTPSSPSPSPTLSPLILPFFFLGPGRDNRCHSRYLTAKAEVMSAL